MSEEPPDRRWPKGVLCGCGARVERRPGEVIPRCEASGAYPFNCSLPRDRTLFSPPPISQPRTQGEMRRGPLDEALAEGWRSQRAKLLREHSEDWDEDGRLK